MNRLNGIVAFVVALAALSCSDRTSVAGDLGAPDRALDGGPRELRVESGRGDARRDGGECPSSVAPRPGTVLSDRGAVSGVQRGASWAFLGIPYAAPPVGPLRLRPPERHACWSDDRAAKAFGERCPQLDDKYAVVGKEDCLTLNLWTPATPPAAPLPVLFFVHGGGNIQGSSAQLAADGKTYLYDGQALSEKAQVVVVTINYRLGALAWLAHASLAKESTKGSAGNYGTLDQIAALEWVQRNIARLGGDPKRVLLFGESAGALDSCLLVTSPLAKGLFSAALMQSGGCAARPRADAEAFAVKFVAAAGCDKAADVPACLRGLPAETLAKTLPDAIELAGKQGNHQPCVDGWVQPDAPLATLAAGKHNAVPFVVGANADETGIAVGAMSEAQYKAAVYALAGSVALGDQILAQYPVADYGTPRRAYVALTSDVKFICGARRVARAAVKGQTLPVYRYHFTHALENGGAVLKEVGAFHALELTFVFLKLGASGYSPSAGELALADAIGGYWSRLAASGDPNGGGAPAWPRYDAASDPYLQLDTTIVAGAGVRTKQCDFWDTLIP
jgi:para-nitrobenzyl esterase